MPAIMSGFVPFEFADKATLIAYFNEEQLDELRNFAVAFFEINANAVFQVTLQDIGYTGLVLHIAHNARLSSHFLPFAEPISQRDDLQRQYIVLVQQSAKILGKASIELKKRQFTLLKKTAVTANMVRLVLQSEQDLSHLPAGYAFLLKTDIGCETQSRAVRYYTLRKAWQQSNAQGEIQNLAWVDVYCHGEKNGEFSLGENWVKSLSIGDKVTSEREFPEKIDHLNLNQSHGQSLLIADETSLPTVARLLETWQHPLPPIILAFLHSETELAYLNEVINENVSKNFTKTLAIIANTSQPPHEQIFATLRDFLQQTPTQINNVWGGLEATTTKKLRPLLLDYLNLSRENMVLKVYWRQS